MMTDHLRRLSFGFLHHHWTRWGNLSEWTAPLMRRRWLKTKVRALINHDRTLRMDVGRMYPAGKAHPDSESGCHGPQHQ